jgi:predicted tellurium resistance membrane protein TerC
MESLFTLSNALGLLTLTGLEVILGIDNVIFIAIIVEHLPADMRAKVRFIGLSLALILRVVLLLGISWIVGLTEPIFSLFGVDFSGRSLLLIAGGLFLVFKPLKETLEMFIEAGEAKEHGVVKTAKGFWAVIAQIVFVDLVLSFDSILTAVGVSNNLPIMISAIVIAMVVMLVSAKPISDFIYKNPSIKIMALSFILLVGVLLVAAGFHIEIPKGYLYFSMFFALAVEMLNIMLKKKQQKHHKVSGQ